MPNRDTARFSKYVLILVIFIGGYNATLPVTDKEILFLLTPFQVIHGIYLDEFLTLVHVGFLLFAASRVKLQFRTNPYVNLLSLLLVVLGIIGIVSAAINVFPQDILKATRLFFFAIYLVVLFNFCVTFGSALTLRTFLVGQIAGGFINLYYSFVSPSTVFGVLPTLMGQAGPGVFLSFAVVLGVLLAKIRASSYDIFIAIVASILGVFSAIISFSKIAMIIASLGVLAWAVFWLKEGRRGRSGYAFVLIGFLVFGAYSVVSDDVYDSIEKIVTVKLTGAGVDPEANDRKRYLYHLAVGEISTDNPVFGVSYSGFFDALQKTEVSREIGEDPESGRTGVSNPHSSLLYYLSANGFPGALVAIVLYIVFSRITFLYLRADLTLFAAIVAANALFFLTIPTLFFSRVFFITLAVILVELRLKTRVYSVTY